MTTEGIPFPRVPDPLKCIVAGSSGSGKSTLVCSMLRDQEHVFGFLLGEIVICHDILDPQFEKLAEEMPDKVRFVIGLPRKYVEELRVRPTAELREKRKCLVLDDLVSKIAKDPELVTDLFMIGATHLHLSVILLTQNFFFKNLRSPSLNANFIVLMRTNRGVDQVKLVVKGSAEDDDEKKLAVQAYKAAMELKTYGHFCIDLSFDRDPRLKYFTGLLSSDVRLYFLSDQDGQRPILKN